MPKIGFGSTLSSSRILTRQLACESSQKTSTQVKAVTKTATAHRQAETEEEAQNEFRMPELLNAVLNRLPRIARRIRAALGPQLGHLFCGVGAERCRRQHAHKRNDSDGGQRRANKCVFGCSH